MPLQKRLLVGAIVGVGITAALIPTGVGAFRRWRNANHRVQLSDFAQTGDKESPYVLTPRAASELEENEAEGEEEEVSDDALLRKMAHRNYYGETTSQSVEAVAKVARREAVRWADLMPKSQAVGPDAKDVAPQALNMPGKTWVNLGPTDARFQFNGTEYLQVDSGRTTGILLHPTSPNIAYTSTSGGGIWKTFTFDQKNPTWYPITETVGNLATGAIAMDPNDPETIYAGLGDFSDAPSGHMMKSSNGGITWSEPLRLTGTYPAASGGSEVSANSIRAIAVDPANSAIVLVGTDVGLFRSLDGGKTYALVDLPNFNFEYTEAIWTIVHAGTVNGVSRWVASGESSSGDIWTSSDGGATWSSRAVAGALPSTSVARIDMGGGTPAADGTTVIYAQVAASDTSSGAGIWRSTDSGATFVSVTGTLRNPTTTSTNCRSQNVQSGQAWYDQAVAVDPANSANVLIGGSLCMVRTTTGLNATPTWELVAHWLPSGNGGQTVDGRLPYMHADHHIIKVYRPVTGGYVAIAGTDGGMFVSRNVFTTSTPTDRSIRWDYPNRGIVTHLFYSVASGDEVTGDPFLVYGGLQDNGTRFRDSPQFPTTFNQIIGGDGIGASASSVPGDRIYWGSVYNVSMRVCDPDTYDCNRGESWFLYSPQDDYPTLPCASDSTGGQFYTRVQAVPTATAATGPAVLTITDKGVWRYVTDPFHSTNSWELLGDPAGPVDVGACTSGTHRNIFPSAMVDGLIGVATSGGRFRVTSNCTLTTPSSQCTWTRSNPLGVDLDKNGTISANEALLNTSNIDFPPGPTGKPQGDVYVAATVSELANDGLPVSEDLGHVFITQDRGQTWQTLKGNGTSDLPNLPVDVIRYDPSDTTNQTIYVGNYIGVYRTTDGGQTWHRFGAGMPLVWVKDLYVSRTGAFVRAATFGRGLWEIYPSATTEKGVNGNGDWDRNLQIDFQDVLATASRLGSSPATTEVPFYEWNQDMTGQVNGIDDADLSALMQHFGGRP